MILVVSEGVEHLLKTIAHIYHSMSILDIKHFILENTCMATMSNKYYLGTRLKTSHLVIGEL
jgi:hypothetical protein